MKIVAESGFVLAVLAHFLFCQASTAQVVETGTTDTDEPAYTIQWLESFPRTNDSLKTGIISRLTQLLIGKSDVEVQRPVSISVSEGNRIWMADQGAGRIFCFEEGKHGPVRVRKSERESFPSLVGTCLLPDGRLLLTDSQLNGIFCYDPKYKTMKRLNDSLELDGPTGIAFSEKSGEIWVAETQSHRLAVLGPDGALIRRIGHRGNGAGEFNFPTHICTDPLGDILVVDAMNNRVQIFDAGGGFISMFGEAGNASGFFARPKGIACDTFGHIYVADALFHVVQVFDRSGRYLKALGSRGSKEGQFWMPAGIFINQDNHIFVSDSYNKRIQVFRLVQ